MQKRAQMIAVLLAVGFGSVHRMSADTISDFESGTTEGWSSVDGIIGLVPDNTTSSQGQWSLRIDRSAGGWSNTMMLNLIGSGLWGTVANNSMLMIDFKAQGGTNVPAWWFNMTPIVNSQNGGWSQQSQVDPTLDGTWRTMMWNYSQQPPVPGDWGEFFLATNTGDLATVWIDNIRVVPEPQAMILIGMACFCLQQFRRKTA
jgi:hypothetical protein